jgi:hypothetical protein
MLMALLACAYLNTNKGIGTIPNEISEDRNSRHIREVRAEFKKKNDDHHSMMMSSLPFRDN